MRGEYGDKEVVLERVTLAKLVAKMVQFRSTQGWVYILRHCQYASES